MKVAVIGATGTIGQAVSTLLENEGHEVIKSSRNNEPKINIDRPGSIDEFYDQIDNVDAVICAAGIANFGALQELTDQQIQRGIQSKLMGQVNLVRKGIEHLNEGGVFILTSGMLASKPWPKTSAVAMVNAGLEGFTRAAALDLPDNKRICIVSPPLISETAKKMGRDSDPWPDADKVAQTYLSTLNSDANGEVIYVPGYEY
ncbi:short chain dehydrogenase [Balneolaceae bacterium YR4-1]|uniref:Short chain dehydrogenase n=1 Tax=Halalkalibaculum roseum TaxID=2709311 RepID=A0A6M1T357_9BACT|nr:short chain dehydrogenase [Halalkalibaculum roseum]NGP76435.1 short chain dehydrogenase [Halalkalibaculum roseum]